jgi:hypothetical protein
MADITTHLSVNFDPPISYDIQMSVQKFFDSFVAEADPHITGWADRPDEWTFEIGNEAALDMEWQLPNGVTIKARNMLNDLRLWDAIWWECPEPEVSYADHLLNTEALEAARDSATLAAQGRGKTMDSKLAKQILDGFADSRLVTSNLAWEVHYRRNPQIERALGEFFYFYAVYSALASDDITWEESQRLTDLLLNPPAQVDLSRLHQ